MRMLNIFRTLILAVVLASPMASAVHSTDGSPDTLAIEWLLVSAPGINEKRWIDKFYPLSVAEVRPARILNLRQPYSDKFIDGAVLMPNTPLALTDRTTITACAASAGQYEKGSDDVPCFIDEDRDGQFDKVFQIQTGATPVPLGVYKLPNNKKKIKKIAPIPYSENSDNQLLKPLYVYMAIDESQTNMLGKTAYFMFCATHEFGENGRLPFARVCYGDSLGVPKPDGAPSKFNALGGEFLLHRIETTLPGWGGGGATITIVRPFQNGSFFRLLSETLAKDSR